MKTITITYVFIFMVNQKCFRSVNGEYSDYTRIFWYINIYLEINILKTLNKLFNTLNKN